MTSPEIPRPDGPVNVLALDGGGIRGLSELVILHELMERLMHEKGLLQRPRPCDYFHLIGGTSTGGLIALLLGRFRLDTEEAMQIYNSCARSIFSKQNAKGKFKDGYFKASTLVKQIRRITEERQMGDRMIDTQSDSDMGKCFVCAVPANDMSHPEHFRSYRVRKNNSANCEIWEAARATTAAPMFFKRIAIGEDGHQKIEFIDGGIRCNNPTEEALREARQVFGDERPLNCLLSIGTGSSEVIGLAKPDVFQRFIPTKLIHAIKHIATDCEETSNRLAHRFDSNDNSYFRFNVARGITGVSLEEWEKMEQVEVSTKQYLKDVEVSRKLDQVVKLLCVPRGNIRTLGSIEGIASNIPTTATLEPACFDIPPSPIFTGRADILHRLTQFFSPCTTNMREYLLWGMGGVGKSQVALKFANDQRDHYEYIYWIDASTSVTIEQGFTAVTDGHSLSIPNHSSAAGVATAWLKKTKAAVLLIFDNVDEYSTVESFIPHGGKIDVIHTSRNREITLHVPDGCSQEVSIMCPEEALELLKRARRLGSQPVGVELQILQDIVDTLGALPLALDQAGAYMYTRACSAEEYYDLFSKQRKILMERADYRTASSQKQAVYATWEMSYQYLERQAEDANLSTDERRISLIAAGFLGIFSNLHNENIPKEMFRRVALAGRKPDCSTNGGYTIGFSFSRSHESMFDSVAREQENSSAISTYESLSKSEDRNNAPIYAASATLLGSYADSKKGKLNPFVLEAIRELTKLSLLQVIHNGQAFSMHTLVHKWAQDRLSPASKHDSRMFAMTLILVSRPQSTANRDDWHFKRLLIPHIVASDYSAVITTDHTCMMALALASFLRGNGSHDEIAQKLLERAVQVLKSRSPRDDKLYFQCLVELLGMSPNVERCEDIREVLNGDPSSDKTFAVLRSFSRMHGDNLKLRPFALMMESLLKVILSDTSALPKHRAFAHWKLSEMYLFQERHEEIIGLLQPMMGYALNREDDLPFWSKLACCEILGKAYQHLHRFDDAEHCFDSLHSQYAKLEQENPLNPKALAKIHRLRMESFRLQGKYSEALESWMALQEVTADLPEGVNFGQRIAAPDRSSLEIIAMLPLNYRMGFDLFAMDWESTNRSRISFGYRNPLYETKLGIQNAEGQDYDQVTWSPGETMEIALVKKDRSSTNVPTDEQFNDLRLSLKAFASRLKDGDAFVHLLSEIIEYHNACVALRGTCVVTEVGDIDLWYHFSSGSTLFYLLDAQSKPEETAFFVCSVIWVEEMPGPASSNNTWMKIFQKLKESFPSLSEDESGSENGIYFGVQDGRIVLTGRCGREEAREKSSTSCQVLSPG